MPGVAEGISSLSLEENEEQQQHRWQEQQQQAMSVEEAQNVVLKWDSVDLKVWDGTSEEQEAYLTAVDALLRSTSIGLRSVLNLAAKKLRGEFSELLDSFSESVDASWLPESFSAPSFSSTTEDDDSSGEQQAQLQQQLSLQREQQAYILDLIPPGIAADLSDIQSRMSAMGRSDCAEDYAITRRSVIEASVLALGVELLSSDEILRMQWDTLAPRLKRWTKALKSTFRALFASERFLCNLVFVDEAELSSSCFGQIANESALQILQLFEGVARAPKSPDGLIPLLDCYEALKDSMQVIEDSFQGEFCSDVPKVATNVLYHLRDAVKETFVTFKHAIESNSSRSAAPGGALHPLTRFVMNYLGLLSEYLRPLRDIYGDEDDSTSRNGGEAFDPEHSGEVPEASALQAEVMRVLEALLQNLEEHSRLYRETALGKVFLMNNTHYIVQKLKALELQAVVNEDWVKRHSTTVRVHAMSYQREAWGRIFMFLRDEGIRSGYSNVSREVLKDRFKNFNTAVEEIHRTQSNWVISDAGFRNELRVLISDKLLPAYRAFLGRYRVHLESVRHHERYLKYTDEDLENMLNDLFEGTSGSIGRRRSLTGSG